MFSWRGKHDCQISEVSNNKLGKENDIQEETITAYQEQMDRVRRWSKRIEPKKGDYGPQKDYADFLRAFFIEAWHLADWIAHDISCSIGDEIWDKALQYDSLKACNKLANQAKHSPINVIFPKLTGIDTTVILESLPKSKYRYRIGMPPNGHEVDALDLVRQIVTDWETVIKDYVESPKKL